jgi:hypothetical protein
VIITSTPASISNDRILDKIFFISIPTFCRQSSVAFVPQRRHDEALPVPLRRTCIPTNSKPGIDFYKTPFRPKKFYIGQIFILKFWTNICSKTTLMYLPILV